MLIQKGNREDAIHTLINIWLKDPRVYCGWCGADFNPSFFPCCEKPFVGKNTDILRQFSKDNAWVRDIQKNKYASTDGKHLRIKLSFPPDLLEFLTKSFIKLYNEDLFTDKYDTTWFAKKFYKYFAIPEEV